MREDTADQKSRSVASASKQNGGETAQLQGRSGNAADNRNGVRERKRTEVNMDKQGAGIETIQQQNKKDKKSRGRHLTFITRQGNIGSGTRGSRESRNTHKTCRQHELKQPRHSETVKL